MFSHMTVGSNDLEKAKYFYDALFTATGGRVGTIDSQERIIYFHNGAFLLVTKPIDGHPATRGNGMTIGLTMDNTDQADAWHAAGLAAGGSAIEDPPGWRKGELSDLYLAYLRDPDGNKLCAIFRKPAAK